MGEGETLSMQVPFLASLEELDQIELLNDLNYLNMAEIKTLCREHGIPFTIRVESAPRKKRRDIDRKGVILTRIRHFLNTGDVLPPTCFAKDVICFDRLTKEPSPEDILCYGQYDKNNRAMVGLLKKLTEGQFRDGAIARIVAREFWSKGEAPTYRTYAAAWLRAVGENSEIHPEWAFLADRACGTAGSKWKQLRAKKAARVVKLLGPDRIDSPRMLILDDNRWGNLTGGYKTRFDPRALLTRSRRRNKHDQSEWDIVKLVESV